jgi:hypothetical protein
MAHDNGAADAARIREIRKEVAAMRATKVRGFSPNGKLLAAAEYLLDAYTRSEQAQALATANGGLCLRRFFRCLGVALLLPSPRGGLERGDWWGYSCWHYLG